MLIGIAVALASTRALGSLLFNVTMFDLSTFIGMSVSMVLVGLRGWAAEAGTYNTLITAWPRLTQLAAESAVAVPQGRMAL